MANTVTTHRVEVTPPFFPEIEERIVLQWRVRKGGLTPGNPEGWQDSNWSQPVDGYTPEQIEDASALLLAQWRRRFPATDEEQRVVRVQTIRTKRVVA